MACPIGALELAVKGRMDLINDILKSIFGGSAEDDEAKKLAEQTPDPAQAAKQLIAALKRRQKADNRRVKKKNR